MKKIIVLLITILTILYIPNVYAKDVSIESITIDSKSDTTTVVTEPTFSNLKINVDVKFTKKDDYIKYKIVINNPTNEDYEITDTKNYKESEYIIYDYSFDDNNKIVEKNKKTIVYLTIKYIKEVPEELLLSGEPFTENNSITISLGSESNPNTGRIIFKGIILIILIAGIALTIYVNKVNKKTFSILLIISLFIPLSVYALKQLSINVESKISFEPPPVFYVNETRYRFDIGMTWDEWLDSPYNTISAYKQKYYQYFLENNNQYIYSYFENDEYGIILDEMSSYCGTAYILTSFNYVTDEKNVTPEDVIKNKYHYNISGISIC